MKNCPLCGSPNDDKAVNCAYCGVAFPTEAPSTPPVQVHIQNTIYTSQPEPIPDRVSDVSPGPFAGWRPWLKVLGWLLCFPLMLTLIALKKKTRRWYVLAAVGWIVYVIWIATAPRKAPNLVTPAPPESVLMETERISSLPVSEIGSNEDAACKVDINGNMNTAQLFNRICVLEVFNAS